MVWYCSSNKQQDNVLAKQVCVSDRVVVLMIDFVTTIRLIWFGRPTTRLPQQGHLRGTFSVPPNALVWVLCVGHF